MAQISNADLQAVVLKLARRFGVDQLSRVEIDPDPSAALDGTVRIVIKLKDLQKADLANLQGLVKAVEESLSEQDDRYPSVRFSEAA